MMKNTAARRTLILTTCALLCALALFFAHSSSAQTQDARPRRVQTSQTPQQTPAAPRPTPSIPGASARQSPTPLNQTRVSGEAIERMVGAPPPPPADPLHAEISEGERIITETDLVNLNVRVIDRANRSVNDARKEDFHVFENGVEQPVFEVSREEVPISYGLAVDTSLSLRTQLPQVIEAAKTIINSNKPGDETFLVRFIDSEKIETVQDFTSDKAALVDSIEDFYTEGGQTAVVDAVYLSADHVANYKKGNDLSDRRRRALIVVTDGEDRGSFYKPEQLFQNLKEEDVQIYVIGFVNELDKEGGLIKKSPRDRAVNLLKTMAEQTGGRAFFPTSLSELPAIANEITHDLRTQYIVSYSPTNKARDGSYRAIRVTVNDAPGREHRIALTRSGYTRTPAGDVPVNRKPMTPTRSGANTNTPPTARPSNRPPE